MNPEYLVTYAVPRLLRGPRLKDAIVRPPFSKSLTGFTVEEIRNILFDREKCNCVILSITKLDP